MQLELAEAEDAGSPHGSGGHCAISSAGWKARPWESSRDLLAIYRRRTNDCRGIEVRAETAQNRGMLFKGAVLALLKITVVVYNSEAVPGPELVRAQTVAGRILGQ